MTEIEKMFENAGIKGEWRDYRTKNGKIYEGKNPKNRNIRLCKPDFTAEKQIELIKWLARKDCMYRLTYERDFLWCSQLEWQSSFCYESFEESLANLINTIWQDLTEQEKVEIRRILNE